MERKTISPSVLASTTLIGWLVDFKSPFLFLESKVTKTNNKRPRPPSSDSPQRRRPRGTDRGPVKATHLHLRWSSTQDPGRERHRTGWTLKLQSLRPRKLQGPLIQLADPSPAVCPPGCMQPWNGAGLLPAASLTPPASWVPFLRLWSENHLYLH